MTIRTDIFFDPELSPRLITVPNSSIDITMQDLHDTVANWEDELHLGMDHDQLISSSGKEDLGGGVLVGITSILLNTLLEFEARTTPNSIGTATATGTTVLSDSAATFITDGVGRGDIIINFTDFSMATVLSVDSETVITHRVLAGGTNNDWTISDIYRVYPTFQVEVAGGNLVTDSGDSPVLPSFGTQVVRTSSSSATVTEIAQVTYTAGGGIHVDSVNGVPGTSFPTGTFQRRSSNLTDARIIADTYGLNTFVLHDDHTLLQEFAGYIFVGSAFLPIVTVNGQDVTGALFKGVTISGLLNGRITAAGSFISGVTNLDGFFRGCGLKGNNAVALDADLIFNDCFSQVAGIDTPILDMVAGTAGNTSFRQYSGGIRIQNFDQVGDNITIELVAGQVILDASCTAGIIAIRGVGDLADNSAGTIVNLDGFMTGAAQTIMRKILQNRNQANPSTNRLEIYNDAGTAIEFSVPIFEDAAGTTPYGPTSPKIERREKIGT